MKKLMLFALTLTVLIALPLLAFAQEAAMVDGVLTNIDPAVEQGLRYGRMQVVFSAKYNDQPLDERTVSTRIRYVTITADMLAEGQTSINLDALRFCTSLQSLTIDAGVPVESFEPLAQITYLRRLDYVGAGDTVDLGFLATCNAEGGSTKLFRSIYRFTNCTTTGLKAPLENEALKNANITYSNPDEAELLDALANWKPKTLMLTLDSCAVNDAVLTAVTDAKITNLTLQNITTLGDLSLLSGKSLTSLTITNAPTVDVSALAGLKKLEKLSLDGCEIAGEFSALKKNALTDLSISNTNVDLSTLEGLSKLEQLSLTAVNAPDLTVLGTLKKLSTLTLEKCTQTDYAPIAATPKLTELAILYPQQEAPDMSWLADAKNLKNLQSLKLVQCGLKDGDLSMLANAKKIETLMLSNNFLTTTEPFSNLSKLYELNLEGNEISDYSFVQTGKLLGADDATYEALLSQTEEGRHVITSYAWEGTYNTAK